MKKIALLAATLFITAAIMAQTVAVVSYMKVAPGAEDAYIALEREWKKIHQARVDDGRMIAWELYYIHNQGTASPYNFATANIYKDLKSAMAGLSEADMKLMGPKWSEIANKTNAARQLVKDEIYNWQMGIQATQPEKFLTVSYMKINKPESYYEMERDAYQPMHKAAIDENKMAGWSIWSRAFPEDNYYQAVAVNGYASLDQMTSMTYTDLQETLKKKMTPNDVVKMVNLINDTEEIRTMVKSQLWESVEVTKPKQ